VYNLFDLNVVSAEGSIFSGKASKLIVTGFYGEFEVLYKHSALLTTLVPGQLWYTDAEGKDHGIFVFGGLVEVQPLVTTVLADSFLRLKDIDEEEVLKTKQSIEQDMLKGYKDFNYAKARVELALAVMQLKFFRKFRAKR
jgi:F-type H+-transporting ATPase subunit epsilon